jgi:S-DNA-T family DNA segregation ATPase FtsK/SpoIIIE
MTVTSWTPERPCPIPGHPQDESPDGVRPALVGESAWDKILRWHLHAPAERLPLPAFLAAWPASWAMHDFSVPVIIPACATCAAAGVSFLTWWWKGRRHETKLLQIPRLSGVEAAALTAAIGGWVTAADFWGPLAGPGHMLSWIYLAGWGYGYWWLRRHEAVRAARQRRDDAAALKALKRQWHQILPRVGLAGWHVADWWKTNLGYELLIVGSPEIELATRIAGHSSGIGEKLEHHLGLPYGRVDIDLTDRPGELIIGVRTVDVSVRKTAFHPMTAPWPEEEPSPFADWFPPQASILQPCIWGFTPEDGSPLSVRLLNELGGRVIGCMGMAGSGKSTLLNNVREFVTRCPDARLVQLNGAHMGDELSWEPLSALTLCGSVANDEKVRNNIAEALAALCLLVTQRSETLHGSGDSTFQPTPEDPAVVVVIDEVDEIVAQVPGAGQMLEFLASKQRKSAISLVLATQRFVVTSIGGGNVRANMSEVLVGVVERDSEARHATGADAEIPDIREYSKGAPGYFQVWDPRAKSVRGRGRTLLLGVPPRELAYIQRLVKERQPLRDWSIPDMPAMVLDGGISAMAGAPGTAEGYLAEMHAQLAAMTSDAPQPGGPAQAAAPVLAPDMQQAVRAAMLGIPQDALAKLEALLARPQGVTSAQAGLKIGKSRSTAHAYLQAMETHGLAVRDGKGRGSRYTRPAKAPATAVPAEPEGDAAATEGGTPEAAPVQAAKTGVQEPARPEGYVTLHHLAIAVGNGEVPADEDQQAVLARVLQLRDGTRPHPHRPAADDNPESDAS